MNGEEVTNLRQKHTQTHRYTFRGVFEVTNGKNIFQICASDIGKY